MTSFSEWLVAQDRERRKACLDHLDVCRRLGIAQREGPYSENTRELTRQVADYYRRLGE